MVAVPRLWPGETVVCLATGPSLTQADVDYVRGKARVIAVNDAYTLAPWADALYAADSQWWRWHDGVPSFHGHKWSIHSSAWCGVEAKYPDVQRLRNTGPGGLETDPTGLRTGLNSGYQAINVAYHYGAARIVLLGYDMQPDRTKSHFFGEHPNGQRSPYNRFLQRFPTLAKPLAKRNVRVINCTRRTVLTVFEQLPLETVFAGVAAAA